jgi:hypothetical protein
LHIRDITIESFKAFTGLSCVKRELRHRSAIEDVIGHMKTCRPTVTSAAATSRVALAMTPTPS